MKTLFYVIGIWFDSQPRTITVIKDNQAHSAEIYVPESVSRSIVYKDRRAEILTWTCMVWAETSEDAKRMAEEEMVSREPSAVPVVHQDNLVRV